MADLTPPGPDARPQFSIRTLLLTAFFLLMLAWSIVLVEVFRYSLGAVLARMEIGGEDARQILALVLLYVTGFAIAGMAGVLLLGAFIAGTIAEPLKKFAREIGVLARGDLGAKASGSVYSELAELAGSFNLMTAGLRRVLVSRDELLKEVETRSTAERRVREQNEFIRRVIDSLPDSFYVIDAATYRIVLANRALAPAGEPAEVTCHQLTHKRDTPCGGDLDPCPLQEVKRTKGPVTLEHTHFNAAGLPRNVEIHAYPVFDEAGAVKQIIEYTIDITARKEMERRIWRFTRLYRMLSNINQMLVRTHDRAALLDESCRLLVADGGFLSAWIGWTEPDRRSMRIAAAWGADAEKEKGRTIPLPGRAADKAAVPEVFGEKGYFVCDDAGKKEAAPFPGGGPLTEGCRSFAVFPFCLEDRLAGTINVCAAEPYFFSGDEVLLLKELTTDISFSLEVMEKEGKLRESEARFEAVLENANDLIQIAAADGGLLYVNRAWREALGYSEEEALRLSAYDVFLPDRREDGRRAFARAAESGRKAERLKTVFVAKSGAEIAVEGSVTARAAPGATPVIHGIFRDITARKRLEEQFLQSQKMDAVGRLSSGVAHDFNNILSAILGYCGILLGEFPAGRAREDLLEIRKAAERAAQLVRDLLTFSRKRALKLEVLSLNALAGGNSNMLRKTIGEEIELVVIPALDLWSVKGDAQQLSHVFMNLAVNARDAMPSGGKLIVETANVRVDEAYAGQHPGTPEGDYVLLSISDTGAGMDRETLAHIFEPFFTTKEPGKGTGLGLATVYALVQQHGGRVSVYSEPGSGTVFRIYLPRVRDAAAADRGPAAGAGTENLRGTGTVLVVEDEEIVRTLTARILKTAGYEVLEARHPREAFLVLEHAGEKVKLVISDVMMPGMTGTQFLRLVNRKRPGLRFILMSAYNSMILAQRGLMEKNIPLLEKPFTSEALLRLVRGTLDSSNPDPGE